MPKIKAIIFDMDGVLLDSREFIYRAMEEVLASHGVQTTREALGKVTGKPVKAMYELIAPQLDTDELEKQHLEHHAQNLNLLYLYDGVEDTLKKLKTHGYQLGIFTGFNEQTYDRLDQFGITGLFDSIVESTRYTAHKPDPEGLYVAMQDFGITNAAEIVYIGDGISDMQVGVTAGVARTIGVSYGFGSKEDLLEHGAERVIDSLPELLPLLDL